MASVIVCTRNRAGLLEGCLSSLFHDAPATSWELVVVDNAATDDTALVVERCRQRSRTVRLEYVVEERLGHSYARNRGVAAARGQYLLFTDDDVLVEPGWIDGLCAGLSDPGVVAVGGQVKPEWPAPPPSWMSSRIGGLLSLTDYGDAPRDLVGDELPIGANMAIRAAALPDAERPFDTRLGHRGGGYFGFDEHALFQKLRLRGRIAYRPDAVVLHRILSERMTWKGMRCASLHNGFGSMRAEQLRGARHAGRCVAVRETARTYVAIRRLVRRNRGGAGADPDTAFEEFYEYWMLGRWVEILFGDSSAARLVLSRLA